MGPNPTDRAKGGVKRSELVDGHGIPLGVVVEGANVHDMKLFLKTLLSIPIVRPEPTEEHPQHISLDKGYAYDAIFEQAVALKLIPNISSGGEEVAERPLVEGYKARHWLVERLHSWVHRYRHLLIRWAKKPKNYLAMIHLAFACIIFRQSRLS